MLSVAAREIKEKFIISYQHKIWADSLLNV